MTDRKIMEQALADLKIAEVDGNCNYGATELLRNRLAQPEQEPSGWKLVPIEPTQEMLRATEAGPVNFPSFCWKAMLSAAPTPPQRKPLTDEQYFEIGQRHGLSSFKVEQIHKEIEEAAHGIKGGHDD